MPILNPTQEYETIMISLRELHGAIHDLNRIIYGTEISKEDKSKLELKKEAIHESIKTLKNDDKFPSREYDIFVSSPELAVAQFVGDNPEPPKPALCEHPDSELRKKIHADGSLHLVQQCLKCGSPLRHQKKLPDIVTNNIDFFDEKLREQSIYDNNAHGSWLSQRMEVYSKARREGGDFLPDFDLLKFQNEYEKTNPQPLSLDSCLHTESELTYRKYNKTDGVVLQCVTCGKHLKSVKKSYAADVNKLPPFDALLEESVNKEYLAWSKGRYEAYQLAKASFNVEVKQKIENGDLTIIDNSTFSTYYDSSEWKRTRIRIMDRDQYKCRCCRSDAECVHHITYERMGKEHDFDLISLCHACHEYVHIAQSIFPYPYKLTPSEIENMSETIATILANNK